MSKPNLPSIQFLLQKADETAATLPTNENTDVITEDKPISPLLSNASKRRYGHRASHSVSSLPVDLQALSLQGPEDGIEQRSMEPVPQPFLQQQKQPSAPHQPLPFNGIPSNTNSAEKPPSWMLPNDRPPVIMMDYTSASSSPAPSISSSSTSAAATPHSRRKVPFTGHGRSVSEVTLPPISSALSQSFAKPLPYTATPSQDTSATNLLPTTTASTTTSSNNNSLSPRTAFVNHSGRKHTQSHHTHRRAISANTLDFMLTPSSHSYGRAQSYSPQEQSLNLINHYRQHPPPSNFFDQLSNVSADRAANTNGMSNNTPTSGVSSTESSSAGRYVCPYCQKKFSRPSSLRIHTYSHTGEKPFVCTEPGCGRHFSVQSNMRRHLRVHRLGRNNNNNSNTSSVNSSSNATPTVLEEDSETS